VIYLLHETELKTTEFCLANDMARFSAFTSDDSDTDDEVLPNTEPDVPARPSPVEEEENEENGASESDSESSSSDMREEELLASPPRKHPSRNALVQDEDGDILYAHEVGPSDERRSPSGILSSRTSPARTRPDNTIIPWAQHIGVDAQKMHVMQTSLFRMPEEAAALKASEQPTRPRMLFPGSLHRKHSRDSDGDGLRLEPREVSLSIGSSKLLKGTIAHGCQRASFAHDVEPLPHRPSRKYARVESAASAVSGNEGAMVDSGLAMGRSFRAAWGPMGVLVHQGELCGPSSATSVVSYVSCSSLMLSFLQANFGELLHGQNNSGSHFLFTGQYHR
jgi:nuclear pore complex protein Nup98-Nup96